MAKGMGFTRISAASTASVQRTIARWESGEVTPSEQYQILLGHAYGRTPLGAVALGPGSDFAELLIAFAHLGVPLEQRDEVSTTVAAAATDSGMGLLTFLSTPLRAGLAGALARPETLDLALLDELFAVSKTINQQVGSVPFVRLHLAQTAVVDACRHFVSVRHPNSVHRRLNEVAATAYTLAARLAFETHDDAAALGLYDEAVAAAAELPELWRRAAVRASQTMVVYYATGDTTRSRYIADAAVRDARQADSLLIRARAHAVQAEMAARNNQQRHAALALHHAWHDLDADTSGDPAAGAFSRGHLQGFDGVCAIFLGEAETARRQLARSVDALTAPRDSVQRAIVLTDCALATLHTYTAGAAEATAEQLHPCVDLIAATRARVPAQRLRQTRLELKPWRAEPFVAELDDHIHSAFVGL